MKSEEIIAEVSRLPVEERALIAESILRSMDPADPDCEREWTRVAGQRLEEIRAGQVQPVSGEQVFARIWKRFSA